MGIRTVRATRYIMPLREGGSLPAIIEADDDGMYVLKFRGAGQGPKALIAELVVGEIARAVGLPVPEIVFVDLDSELARTEPDPEIQELIRGSSGLNLALEYLPGSVMFDPVSDKPSTDLASAIVWLDAFTTNVDRTARNTNMLMWHKKLWLIDHGAALYFHHSPSTLGSYIDRSQDPFSMISKHVLLPIADSLSEVDQKMTGILTAQVIQNIIDQIPDVWLSEGSRDAYQEYFVRRLALPHPFLEKVLEEATRVQSSRI